MYTIVETILEPNSCPQKEKNNHKKTFLSLYIKIQNVRPLEPIMSIDLNWLD